MKREKTRLLQVKLVLLDIIGTLAAFFLAYVLRDRVLSDLFGEIYPLSRYRGVVAMAVAILPVLLALTKAYETDENVLERSSPVRRYVLRLAQAVVLEYVILSVLVFSLKLIYVSRLLIGLFMVLAFVLLASARAALWPALYRRAHKEPLRILIVGSGPKARDLAATLTERRHIGTAFLGFVTEKGSVTDQLSGHPVLGNLDSMASILDNHIVDEVLIAANFGSSAQLEPLLLLCEERGITARLAFELAPPGRARLYLERLDDTPLLTFSTVPNNTNLLALKRVTDVALSSLFLVLTSPVFLVVPILIKLTSKGPVFYRQIRCGLNGRRFTFYKFRSMVDGADEQRDELAHLNEAKGPIFKISSDPRVTAIGRVLRKTSIDELPQLWNVLKGEMSLVGPRPPLPEEVERYQTWQRRRMSMKPGLTCLWQVSGRSALSFDEWVAMDLNYIDNWSLGYDFRILLRTIPAVLSRRGAW